MVAMRTINRLITLAAGISLMATSLTGREFTDNQGRKVEGTVTAFVAGSVSLKREEDGRVFQFPMKLLSEADQKYVTEWILSNKKFDFDVKTTRKKLGSQKSSSGATEITREKWAYTFEMKNVSGVDCPAAEVSYWVFGRNDQGSGVGRPRLEARGNEKVEAVGNLRTTSITTNPIELTKTQLAAGYYYTDGTRPRTADRMGGIAIKVKAMGKEIFAYESEDGLLAATGSVRPTTRSDDPDR